MGTNAVGESTGVAAADAADVDAAFPPTVPSLDGDAAEAETDASCDAAASDTSGVRVGGTASA